MGCDIHPYVEKYNSERGWYLLGPTVAHHVHMRNRGDLSLSKPDIEIINGVFTYAKSYFPFLDRNYKLFEVLAGVRGDSTVAHHLPRGVPSGCSEEYAYEVSQWDSDGHSHSWYYLEELIDIYWGRDAESCVQFITEFIPYLKYHAHGDYSSIRFCFFFDN